VKLGEIFKRREICLLSGNRKNFLRIEGNLGNLSVFLEIGEILGFKKLYVFGCRRLSNICLGFFNKITKFSYFYRNVLFFVFFPKIGANFYSLLFTKLWKFCGIEILRLNRNFAFYFLVR
jgi:hypothetical protein